MANRWQRAGRLRLKFGAFAGSWYLSSRQDDGAGKGTSKNYEIERNHLDGLLSLFGIFERKI